MTLPHVIVCGGRGFDDYELLCAKLDTYTRDLGKIVIVTGACPTGADALAERWAHARMHTVKHYHAEWDTHGKAAGPIRNEEMIRETSEQPSVFAVVFWDGKSKGTKDALDWLRRYKIPTKTVRY